MTSHFKKNFKADDPENEDSFHSMDVEDVLEMLDTAKDGLSSGQCKERLKRYGLNKIKVPNRLTAISLFLSQFKSPLIIALIIAGGIAISFGKWIEAGVIFLAVAVNTVLGFYQENKAERSLELLNTYTKHHSRVRRNGEEHRIEADKLVVGDIIILAQGDRVPADARVIRSNNAVLDEAVLTGESLTVKKDPEPVEKDTGVAERRSMVYSGTSVVGGYLEAVIVLTGAKTEYGKIAELVAEKRQQETPLQRSIRVFSIKAGIVLTGMGGLLFGLGYFGSFLPFFEGRGLEEMFFIAVAAIVSAVPEGLPIAVTVVLALGVNRLAKQKGVVRKLLAAETLGSTTTIITDKTGTLTEARMKIDEVSTYGSFSQRNALDLARRNVDVTIENKDDDPIEWEMTGDALEQAIVREIGQKEIPDINDASFSVHDRLPFDTERKYSASVTAKDGDSYTAVFLGAPEVIVNLCDLTSSEKKEVLDTVNNKARAGGRVLLLARAITSSYDGDIESSLSGLQLKLVALISFRDPIRMSVKGAIERIGDAGVKTVIVTGDHRGTASFVAEKLGILTSDDNVVDGDDLTEMSKADLRQKIETATVFARVTPSQKVRILEAFQDRGDIVAVTGDGVNDAPALKMANIGVAMGAGTDVAKSSSDLVILDNNYETIVSAIEEGRGIVSSLRKVIIFLLSDSFDELILIGGAIMAAVNLPLSAIQILFVKVFTDTLPALAFPFDRSEENFNRPPEKLRRSLFDRETKVFTIGRGLFSAVMLFAVYIGLLWYTDIPEPLIQTFTFASFSTYILFLVFPLRSISRNIWEYNPLSNWYINGAVAVGMIMTAASIYMPIGREILGTVCLPPIWLLGVLAIGVVNVASIEILKAIYKPR